MQIKNLNKPIVIISLIALVVLGTGGYLLKSGLNKGKKVTIQPFANQSDNVQSENFNDEQIVASPEVLEENDLVLPDKQENEMSSEKAGDKNEEKNPKIITVDQNSPSDIINWGYEASSSRKISAIIIHSSYDALGNNPYDFKGLLAEYKSYGVSAHYVIDRGGEIHQLVNDKNIAYHAGKSQLPNGETGVNVVSIGIELMNTEKDNYTAAQYKSLKELIVKLKSKYPIKYVLGHKDVAPGRKTDPWNFDWNKL